MGLMQQVTMLQTVYKNYKGCTTHEVENTILAHKVQAKMGHPTDAKFKLQVREKLLKNCPVKLVDVTNTASIFVSRISLNAW